MLIEHPVYSLAIAVIFGMVYVWNYRFATKALRWLLPVV